MENLLLRSKFSIFLHFSYFFQIFDAISYNFDKFSIFDLFIENDVTLYK